MDNAPIYGNFDISLFEGSHVKKSCIELSYKYYLIFTLVLFVTIGPMISSSYGEEKKVKWGFSILGGMGDAIHSDPDMRVYGLLPRISLPLSKRWDLEFEGDVFYYDIQNMHDVYFLGVSHNFVFSPIQERWGSFFLLVGAGLGYDSAGKRLNRGDPDGPVIGDQHFAGFFNAGTGMLFDLGRGTALRLEYRFYHLSEPFDTSDRGLNTHTLLLGISFR